MLIDRFGEDKCCLTGASPFGRGQKKYAVTIDFNDAPKERRVYLATIKSGRHTTDQLWADDSTGTLYKLDGQSLSHTQHRIIAGLPELAEAA